MNIDKFEFYTSILTNSVTILLALVAGMIALYQVKLNVISNSRIKWIENLRETISDYCMSISKCSLRKNNLFGERERIGEGEMDGFLDKFYEPYTESAQEVEKLQTKVFLYLNSNKKNHSIIENLISENAILIRDVKNDNREQINANILEIVIHSKEIFKTEWEKSKQIFKI